VWTKDGQRLVFMSTRAGAINIFEQAADGTGATERLTQSMNQQVPTDVSLDGQLIFFQVTPMMGRDLMLLSLDVTHRVQTLLQTAFEERGGRVSPDGRWLVYESNSSGRFEVYVRPFPSASAGPAIQISTAGGTRAVWARSGRELFFIAPDGPLMAVRVNARGATWSADTPTKLFDSRYFTGVEDFLPTYDVAPDGRFLMIKEAGADQSSALPHIVVVQHWFEDLKRLVPATR
jgi:serine/threonine-protein kinase